MEKSDKTGRDDAVRPQVTLLNASALEGVCVRGHLVPSEDLAAFVAVAWTLEWNLPSSQKITQQVLPNPSVQIVVSASRRPEVIGIVTGAFSTTLNGQGFLFGLRFKPCGFHAVFRRPAAQFTNRRSPLARLLPDVDCEYLQRLAMSHDKAALMQEFEGALRRLKAQSDETGASLESLIRCMEEDPDMLTVEQAARCFGTSSRTLQRLFDRHVGVSPKWILRRFRLKEAAARIERGERDNIAHLAQRLGYYDQSHLNRDFRAMIGQPPGAWSRKQSASPSAR